MIHSAIEDKDKIYFSLMKELREYNMQHIKISSLNSQELIYLEKLVGQQTSLGLLGRFIQSFLQTTYKRRLGFIQINVSRLLLIVT